MLSWLGMNSCLVEHRQSLTCVWGRKKQWRAWKSTSQSTRDIILALHRDSDARNKKIYPKARGGLPTNLVLIGLHHNPEHNPEHNNMTPKLPIKATVHSWQQ